MMRESAPETEARILAAIMHNPNIDLDAFSVPAECFRDEFHQKTHAICKNLYAGASRHSYDYILHAGLRSGVYVGISDMRRLEEINAMDEDGKNVKKMIKMLTNGQAGQDYEVASGPLKPKITCLDDVEIESVNWLWYKFLATRKLTMLEGDPGDGKTFFALALIAIITNGWPFPDETGIPDQNKVRTPGNVVYMTAEDGLADTIKPRLEMLGADHKRVFILEGYIDDNEPDDLKQVSLLDLNILRQTFEQVRPVLMVVDPLQAYLGAGVDMHRANEVRPVLTGLLRLAEEHDSAIIFIRHLNKAGGGKALYRGMGSIDFNAAARSVLLVGRDPDDEQKRVVVQTKSSLSDEAPAIGFTLDEHGFTWTGESELTAEQILGNCKDNGDTARSTLEDAVNFLTITLADGPVESKEIFNESKNEGIAKRTLERAKTKLGVKAFKDPGPGGAWKWRIPTPSNTAGGVGGVNLNPDSMRDSAKTAKAAKLDIDKDGGVKINAPMDPMCEDCLESDPWLSIGREIT